MAKGGHHEDTVEVGRRFRPGQYVQAIDNMFPVAARRRISTAGPYHQKPTSTSLTMSNNRIEHLSG